MNRKTHSFMSHTGERGNSLIHLSSRNPNLKAFHYLCEGDSNDWIGWNSNKVKKLEMPSLIFHAPRVLELFVIYKWIKILWSAHNFVFSPKPFLIFGVLSAFNQSIEAGSRHKDYSLGLQFSRAGLFFFFNFWKGRLSQNVGKLKLFL